MLTQRSALASAPLHHCPVAPTSERALYQGCGLSGCLQTDTRPSVLSPSTQTQLLGCIPAPAIWRRNKGPLSSPSPWLPRGDWGVLAPSWPQGRKENGRSSQIPSLGRQLLPLVLSVDEILRSSSRHVLSSCKCQALDQALGTRE